MTRIVFKPKRIDPVLREEQPPLIDGKPMQESTT
jgi:hypothetical protein